MHLVHTAAAPVAFAPPSLTAMPIVDRMVEVIRRHRLRGQPTTLADFLQAEETCDLSEATLAANIGAAKRVMSAEVIRVNEPSAPVMPWEIDTDYRKERVAKAAGILVDLPLAACTPSAFSELRHGYSDRELTELWPEIIAEAFNIIQQRRFARA